MEQLASYTTQDGRSMELEDAKIGSKANASVGKRKYRRHPKVRVRGLKLMVGAGMIFFLKRLCVAEKVSLGSLRLTKMPPKNLPQLMFSSRIVRSLPLLLECILTVYRDTRGAETGEPVVHGDRKKGRRALASIA